MTCALLIIGSGVRASPRSPENQALTKVGAKVPEDENPLGLFFGSNKPSRHETTKILVGKEFRNW